MDGNALTPRARTTNTSIQKKSGKVTIPRHNGDLNIKTANSILKQAGIK
jgi:hypothetical protein